MKDDSTFYSVVTCNLRSRNPAIISLFVLLFFSIVDDEHNLLVQDKFRHRVIRRGFFSVQLIWTAVGYKTVYVCLKQLSVVHTVRSGM